MLHSLDYIFRSKFLGIMGAYTKRRINGNQKSRCGGLRTDGFRDCGSLRQIRLQNQSERSVRRSAEKGQERINKSWIKRWKGKATPEQKKQTLENLSFTTKLDDFKDVDLVIEAVIENMEEKKRFTGL